MSVQVLHGPGEKGLVVISLSSGVKPASQSLPPKTLNGKGDLGSRLVFLLLEAVLADGSVVQRSSGVLSRIAQGDVMPRALRPLLLLMLLLLLLKATTPSPPRNYRPFKTTAAVHSFYRYCF